MGNSTWQKLTQPERVSVWRIPFISLESVLSEAVVIPEPDLPVQDTLAVMEAFSPEDTQARMKERFLLTPCEADVLRELVKEDEKGVASMCKVLEEMRNEAAKDADKKAVERTLLFISTKSCRS